MERTVLEMELFQDASLRYQVSGPGRHPGEGMPWVALMAVPELCYTTLKSLPQVVADGIPGVLGCPDIFPEWARK